MSGYHDRARPLGRHDEDRAPSSALGVAPGKTARTDRLRSRPAPSIARGALTTARACAAQVRTQLPDLAKAVDPHGERDIDRARKLSNDAALLLSRIGSSVMIASDNAATPEIVGEVSALRFELGDLESAAKPLLALQPPSYSDIDDVMAAVTFQDPEALARLDDANARERVDWNATLDAASAQEGPTSPADAMTGDPTSALAATQATGLGGDQGALEAAFGVPLGGVKLHGDASAGKLAAGLGAQAFAVGDSVALPPTLGGDRAFVLAHEIAHVVQQRGGTGGDGDPEVAANAAAAAIVSRQPVPRQPAASVGVACFQGAVETTPVVTYGTGGAVSHNAPAIGEQNANASNEPDLSRGADERDLSDELLQEKYKLEQPKPTTAFGGAAPYFVTGGERKTVVVSGSSGKGQRNSPHDQQRNLPIVYKPHFFHVRSAIIRDVFSARSLDEIVSIWSAYLADKPQAPPWPLRPKASPRNAWEIETCSVDGPGYWEPSKLTLPAGSPMEPQSLAVVRVGDDIDDIVQWPNRLTPFPEDADGAARIGTLKITIEALAEADLIPGLADIVLADKRRKAKSTTDPAPTSGTADTVDPKDPIGASTDPQRRPIVTLRLPVTKEPHFARYQSLAGEHRLVHEPDYKRGNPKQRKKWAAEMEYGAPDGVTAATWREGKKLMKQLGRKKENVYLPNWSRTTFQLEMDVDHVIELQLVTSADRGWANSISNFELLDESSNGSSGTLIDQAIKEERKRLFAETGDAKYVNDPLVFDRVVIGGGIVGQRWSPEEIRTGVHLQAMRAHVDYTADVFDAIDFW